MAYKVFLLIKSTFVLSIEILISILLSTIIIPFGLILTFVNETLRLIVSGLLSLESRRCPENGKVCLADEGADNIWSYKKPHNARVCLAVLMCKNEIDLVQHQKLYMSRVLNHTTKNGFKPYEKLRKILTIKFGYNCHKLDNNFDIKNHVKLWPGNATVDKEELMGEILPELFKDMEEDKPQWEEVVIQRFKETSGSSPCSLRIFRYHHGFMDGASNLLLWTACMTEDQGASYPYPVNPLVNSGKTSKCQRFIYDLSCVILGAFTMVKSILRASKLKSRFVTQRFSGRRHFGWSGTVDVGTLRRIKATHKVSVPAMLTTALGSAFRKLNERFPSAEFGNPEEIIIGLVSALVPYANHNLRNQFTVVHFPVYTGSKKADPVKRLEMTSRNMVKIGRDPIVYLNYFMFKYFGRFPFGVVQGLMENGGLPVVLSNVPMSTEVVKFWGNPVITAAGFPPLLTNTGLGIVTMRYADHMRFCAVADDACLSSAALQYLLKEVEAELNGLAAECSDFETIVHKRENDASLIMLMGGVPPTGGVAADEGSNNNKNNSASRSNNSNIVTMDIRRGSIPSQMIDAIENNF